jgi:hypothetical protein
MFHDTTKFKEVLEYCAVYTMMNSTKDASTKNRSAATGTSASNRGSTQRPATLHDRNRKRSRTFDTGGTETGMILAMGSTATRSGIPNLEDATCQVLMDYNSSQAGLGANPRRCSRKGQRYSAAAAPTRGQNRATEQKTPLGISKHFQQQQQNDPNTMAFQNDGNYGERNENNLRGKLDKQITSPMRTPTLRPTIIDLCESTSTLKISSPPDDSSVQVLLTIDGRCSDDGYFSSVASSSSSTSTGDASYGYEDEGGASEFLPSLQQRTGEKVALWLFYAV